MTIPMPDTPDWGATFAAWTLPRVQARQGLELVTPVPDARLPHVGPYVSIARFTLSGRVFPPHPHAGFTALTYVLRSSPGAMLNRDSLGTVLPIVPGGAHWTIANAGMVHEETPELDDVPVEGLQIFVNHPLSSKDDAPRTSHLEPGAVMDWQDMPGARIRLVMGAWGTRRANSEMPTDVTLADLCLDPGAFLVWSRAEGETAMLYVETGAVVVTAAGRSVEAGAQGVVMARPEQGDLTITAGASGAVLFAFAGTPLGEAAVAGGPFIMGSQAEVERAYARFRNGDMGHLTPRADGPTNGEKLWCNRLLPIPQAMAGSSATSALASLSISFPAC